MIIKMKLLISITLILNLTLLSLGENQYEMFAGNLLKKAEKFMDSHWRNMRDIFLTSTQKFNTVNHAPRILEIQKNYRTFSSELAKNLSHIPLKEINNAILARQIQLLGKLQLTGLEETDYDKATSLLKTMKNMAFNKLVGHYILDDKVAYLPQVNDKISRSRQWDELSYYWTAWRKESSDVLRASYLEYIYLFRKAAGYNGHVSPSRTWYLYYEEDNFLKELENAVNELMPLYKEFHAFMRHELQKKYGEKVIEDDGMIPEVLMDQIIQNSWKARSVFHPPYPEKKLPDIKQKMDSEVFTPIKINEISSQFFESMGLNQLSQNFWTKYARKMSDEEAGDDCKASVFFFPPDVALRYCPKVDFKKFLQMHGHMAELQYNFYKIRLPLGLERDPCPGFSSAVGEAAIVSAGSPRHLERIRLIDNYSLDDKLSMNRLFRLGVHTIFTIPMYFVHEKFIVDSLDYRIMPKDLNCGYWKLQHKYAGVSPPIRRNENFFDPGYKFFNVLDPSKPNTVKLLSELLGYQIYKALCIKSGQYIKDNPSFPLHNCDFYASRDAGNIIKKIMTSGSRKKWRDILEEATGERHITAKPILEYYAPLHKWLKEENRRNRTKVGWDSDDKCDSEL